MVWIYAGNHPSLLVPLETWFVTQYVIYSGECSMCTWEECAFCSFRMKCSEYISKVHLVQCVIQSPCFLMQRVRSCWLLIFCLDHLSIALCKLKGKKSEKDKTYETLDSGKQTEGCRRGVGWADGVTGWWALRRACDVMSTGCYIRLMNHWPPPLKPGIHYMLINWI